MKARSAEGWYLDPYELHHDRWISAGQPTKLVRDGHTADEACDEPPYSAQKARQAVMDLQVWLPPVM